MPALEDSCLDQSDADLFYISEENRNLRRGMQQIKELMDDLEENYDFLELSRHWNRMRAIVLSASPTTKSSGVDKVDDSG